MHQTTNTNARQYILKCQEFNGAKNTRSDNNYAVSGRRVGHLYAVYSYGHWPMYVCDTRTDTWFRNSERASPTTSKQSSQCYPTGKDCAPLPTEELQKMLDWAVSFWNQLGYNIVLQKTNNPCAQCPRTRRQVRRQTQ